MTSTVSLSLRETERVGEYDTLYRRGQLPVMQAIEQRACGCTYGATGWATRTEADRIAAVLRLGPGVRLLEIGAGSGWPSLYLAVKSGCDLTLTDLPVDGLKIAMERASREGIDWRCRAVIASATWLPFLDGSFDVINQTDVLCCLVQKATALSECRRVIRPGGRMACSLIYVPTGLDTEDHARAVQAAPEFVEVDTEYPALFAATGWVIVEQKDLTGAFAASCKDMLAAEEALRADVEAALGVDEAVRQRVRMTQRVTVLERQHLKRELFILEAAT